MKRMAGCFTINDKDGTELDRFVFMVDGNNHGDISNKSGCLFSGYYPEAFGNWERIKEDMKICEMLGHTVNSVK